MLNATNQINNKVKTLVNDVVNVTKITDLFDDCLEHIFIYLNLNDLINIAKTDSRLFQASCNTFIHKFSAIEQTLNKIPQCETYSGKESLYTFGHLMKKLRIWPINNDLFNYCYKKECENCSAFPNLKSLSFEAGTINQSISFNKWFPNLERLTLKYVNVTDPSCIEINLPALHTLSISNNFSSAHASKMCRYFSNENVKNAIAFNPQLKHLSLCHEYNSDAIRLNINLLQFINETLPQLESFEMHIILEKNFNDQNQTNDCVRFDKLKEATIYVSRAEVLKQFPAIFDKLEKLSITLHGGLSNEILDFLVQHNKLITLTLKAGHTRSFEISQSMFFNTIIEMNHLRDVSIEFSFCEFLNNKTVDYLTKCKSLMKLNVRCWKNPQDNEHQIKDFQLKMQEFYDAGADQWWTWNIYYNFDVKDILSHFTFPVEINESGEEYRELSWVDVEFLRKM